MLVRSRLCLSLFACALSVALAGCRSEHPEDPRLYSVLWVQTSAEYPMIAEQTYLLAREQLDRALADRDWSAALEQPEGFDELPPAVIVDVDETVLDNLPFDAMLVKAGVEFSREMWDDWVSEARAEAVPGALEFVEHAVSRGVAVFYLTNREHGHEEATRRNLLARGFPVDDRVDSVLTKGEKEEWGDDKGSRRRHLAERYRILLVIGDDVNDFVSRARAGAEAPRDVASAHRAFWGHRWIVLPNPVYGTWEKALFGFEDDLGPRTKLERMYGALRGSE